MSPRQASHFLLLRQKKVTKEKATPLAATLRFAAGSLRCSLFAGSAQTRFAQTRAALIREKLRSSATARGDLDFNAPWRVLVWGARAPALQVFAHAAQTQTHAMHVHMPMPMLIRMRRSVHMRMRPHPLPLKASRSEAVAGRAKQWPDTLPSARAEERSFRRIKGRACLSEASLRGPRLKRAPQVARSEAKGHAQRGRLFFGYFLLAKQKKVTRLPGRRPGSSLKQSAMPAQANKGSTAAPGRKRDPEREQETSPRENPPSRHPKKQGAP